MMIGYVGLVGDPCHYLPCHMEVLQRKFGGFFVLRKMGAQFW